MRPILTRLGPIGLAGVAHAGLALTLVAQPAQAQDMRYLSWNGKPQQTAPAVSAPQAEAPRSQPVRYPSMASMGRPSRYSPSVASGGLTPADAWFNPTQPRPQPTSSQPSSSSQPYPVQAYPVQAHPVQAAQTLPTQGQPSLPLPAYAMAAPGLPPQPVRGTAPFNMAPSFTPPAPPAQQPPHAAQYAAPPAAWTQPGYAPQVYSGAPTPQPAPQMAPAQTPPPPSPVVSGPGWASPQPNMTGASIADPMAPRRDAPIFSIQAAQGAGQVAAPQPPQPVMPSTAQPQPYPTVAASPPREGARYYSVHRQAGRQPDPAEIPDSVYAVIPEGAFLDAARPDLADPPPAPMATRTINGRVQAINRGDDPSLP